MPWYYAGPEAKPVGPVTLEELHARRLNGLIAPVTYVIEHTDRIGEPREWKRYRELFPGSASAPPPPPVPPAPVTLPPVPSHPHFPSAGATPPPPIYAPYVHTPSRPLNALCLWGFILGLAGFIFSFAYGIGLLLAVPGFILSLVGIFLVRKNSPQSGRGFAFWGLSLSTLAVVVALIFAVVYIATRIQSSGWTIMEQTTNDSD